MSEDFPFLLVAVDGPSEARDNVAGTEAGGVMHTIVRQVFGDEAARNIAIRYWRQIRLSPQRRARGHVEKACIVARSANETTAYGALLLLDADRHADARLSELREGVMQAGCPERAAVGVAREMIEAWLLADPALLSTPLPAGKGCEELWGDKGDPTSNYPKHVLRRCVLEPRGLRHADAVASFNPTRARPHAPSLDAFMTEVQALAERQYVR